MEPSPITPCLLQHSQRKTKLRLDSPQDCPVSRHDVNTLSAGEQLNLLKHLVTRVLQEMDNDFRKLRLEFECDVRGCTEDKSTD